jgi:hypothetical protein
VSDDRAPVPAPDPADRLQALSALRAADPAARADALRRLASDPAEDGAVRAAAILLLAHDERFDDEFTVEPGAPAVVASAAEKAREVQNARRLVTRAMAGEAVPAALFDVPVLSAPAELPPVEVGHASEDDRRGLSEVLKRHTRPVTREPAEVPVVTCGRRAWAVLVDPELLDLARLGDAPARPASVASRDLIDQGEWSVPLEVITAPRDGAIAIAVVDRRGRTRYVGSGAPADEEAIEFSVQSADRLDARPVRVQGSLRAGRLELTRVERGAGAAQRLPLTPLRARPAPSSR